MSTRRNERALRVIRNLRMRQNRLDKQIDILCRDIVGAHEEFIRKISNLAFSVEFQESLLGAVDLNSLLTNASVFLKERFKETANAIFLLESKGFDIHFSGSAEDFVLEKGYFENWFTLQLVGEISRAGHVCTLEQMLAMGLQANPSTLKHLTAVAIPLGKLGKGVGFVLMYRNLEKPFILSEISTMSAISPCLRIAIQKMVQLNNAINTSNL